MDILTFSLPIILLAFVCEYIDSSLGMGYGSTLSPLLLIMGYSPLQVVPAILLSELFSGVGAGLSHHRMKNVNFRRGQIDLKIVGLMSILSLFGALVAVVIAVKLPSDYIKFYIGLVVLSMGVIILTTLHKTFRFTWFKISGLGLLASFNKGVSGGGYGPLVTAGQILAGVQAKNAVGITSMAEGITCFVGVMSYLLLTDHTVDWSLAPSLVLGAVLSVPLAAYTVKILNGGKLKILVGAGTLILGLVTLLKLFF